MAHLKLLSAVAFFILLIAGINFMNLATARFAHRSREVVVIVGIAAAVASPLAFLLARGWLRDFAFRISIHPLMFVATGATVLTIAVLSIAFRAIRAAATNPVDTLRYE